MQHINEIVNAISMFSTSTYPIEVLRMIKSEVGNPRWRPPKLGEHWVSRLVDKVGAKF